MNDEVSAAAQPRRPVAVVAAATTWERFPGQWRGMLDEVWACLRQAGVKGGCNVMLYRDLPQAGHVAVEVGVEISEPLPTTGAVVMSALPAGTAPPGPGRPAQPWLDLEHRLSGHLPWPGDPFRPGLGRRPPCRGSWGL